MTSKRKVLQRSAFDIILVGSNGSVAAGALCPVLDLEVSDPSKLADIVCHQNQSKAAGMRGNEEVVGSYGRTITL